MLRKRLNHKTVKQKKIKYLTNYKVSLFVQGLISIVFLYFFYRINKTTIVLEAELDRQTTTSKELHRIVDSIEQQIAFFNSKDSLEKKSTPRHFDPARKGNLSPQKSPGKTQIPVKSIEKTKTPINVPISVVTEEIKMYEYEYKEDLTISNSKTIIEIKGDLLIKYDVQKQPRNYTAQIEMKQIDELKNGAVQKLTFRCIGCEMSPNNTFRCIFQENPLPAANEFEALTPRKLLVAITGSFETLGMNGTLEWNEVTGQPRNLKIKMVLKRTN